MTSKRFDLKNKILEMIEEISGTHNLAEARAECLLSGHYFEQLRFKLNLSAEDITDIMFSGGRAAQLGVLFGLLWHTNNIPDTIEIEAKELFAEVQRTGIAKWRVRA